MSARHLQIIALGLAVLLLLWGGSELLSRGSDKVVGRLAIPTLTPAGVDTVTLVKGGDSMVLAKHAADQWTANGWRAAAGGVTDLVAALQDTGPPELVAQDPSSFGRLGVDSAGGRWLRVRGRGKLLVQLIVGARGSEFESVYVRRPGDSHVYLWHGRLGALADRAADEWREKRIVALSPDSIAGVAVDRGKEHYALAHAGGRWLLGGRATDSAAVVRYLDHFRTVTASGFATAPQADSIRARRPTRRLTVRGGGGRVLFQCAFDSTPTGFLVRPVAGRGGEGATVYKLTVWDVDGLTPAGRSLLPAPATPPKAPRAPKKGPGAPK
ncbi:MAG TPA: DUF4340 domain-containing protein [Gemmatimonadales bacterium]|jgi:hypothetical protein|nr:DUF4340 domain-containing protein [Gemmatimonadales bacterium]